MSGGGWNALSPAEKARRTQDEAASRKQMDDLTRRIWALCGPLPRWLAVQHQTRRGTGGRPETQQVHVVLYDEQHAPCDLPEGEDWLTLRGEIAQTLGDGGHQLSPAFRVKP